LRIGLPKGLVFTSLLLKWFFLSPFNILPFDMFFSGEFSFNSSFTHLLLIIAGSVLIVVLVCSFILLFAATKKNKEKKKKRSKKAEKGINKQQST